MSTQGGGARHGILNLAIKDKAHLHGAWMPFVKGGGIFVPSIKRFALGDEVFLLLTLPESNEKYPVPGKVIWLTPPGAQGSRVAGVGVQFTEGGDAEAVRSRIEALLAGMNADKPTNTM
ncbi:MAG TPA: PilZ domain-containing protein [Luteimonas sp.]|nr:PilZ domain-containing protein [Luteimonas sp.]